MKSILLTFLAIGLAIWGAAALFGNSSDLSYKSQVFTVEVAQAKEEIRTSFESGGSGISFALKAPKATSSQHGEKTVYKLSEQTSIEYETLKGQKSGLKETIILSDKT